jgi:gas vesicle protein
MHDVQMVRTRDVEERVKKQKMLITMSVTVGAVAGGVAGYRFLPETGRQSLKSLRVIMDELARELSGVGQSLHNVTDVARSNWTIFDELVNEANTSTANQQPTMPATH